MAKKNKKKPARGLIAQAVVPGIGRGTQKAARGLSRLPPWAIGAAVVIIVISIIAFPKAVASILFWGLVAVVGVAVFRRLIFHK